VRNPRLVYCSISGYGQEGPSRDEAAMDLVVQASSGLLSITGTEQGENTRCGYGVTDTTAGLFSAIGILMALRARDVTGAGQYVDVAMLDSMIFTMSSNYMSYLGSGQVPRPMGTAFPTVVPYRVLRAADTAVAVAIGSEKLWSAFCRAIERPDLAAHPDYSSNGDRIRNRGVLEPLLESEFQRRPAAEWVKRLQAAGIPASPVRNFQEVVEHPQSAVRRMFPEIEHPAAGRHRVTGTPIKFSETPGAPGAGAPLLGEHTSAVLRELLGLGDAEIEGLARDGVMFERREA
jgi:crotonobetainyl-CoA:carnitine CoA-transferase CaiB-like acyl-CoA transferase